MRPALLGIWIIALLASCKRPEASPPHDSQAKAIDWMAQRPLPYLRLPKTAGPKPALLLVLHGYGSDGASHVPMFELGELAERETVIVAAPDGTAERAPPYYRYWNAVPSCCDFAKAGPDDAAYLHGVVTALQRKHQVSNDRTFVAGHSNGGAMALELACVYPGLFAGVLSFAGPFHATPTDCEKRKQAVATPAAHTRMVIVHGTSDKVVPYEGGPLRKLHEQQEPRLSASPLAIAKYFLGASCTSNSGGATPFSIGAPHDLDLKRPGAETKTEIATCGNRTVQIWSAEGVGHGLASPSPTWMAEVWQAWNP
jgi:poly(3-hydroxybutyrate) depolymerase